MTSSEDDEGLLQRLSKVESITAHREELRELHIRGFYADIIDMLFEPYSIIIINHDNNNNYIIIIIIIIIRIINIIIIKIGITINIVLGTKPKNENK